MSFLREGPVAELARKGSLPGVHAQVHNERLLLREALETEAALEGLVGAVHARVSQQLSLVCVRHEAHGTLVRGFLRVQSQVVHKLELAVVGLGAVRARVALAHVVQFHVNQEGVARGESART